MYLSNYSDVHILRYQYCFGGHYGIIKPAIQTKANLLDSMYDIYCYEDLEHYLLVNGSQLKPKLRNGCLHILPIYIISR